jgi:hypothetical protein
MAKPWTTPTGRIVLVAGAAAAEVFFVLALLWTIDSNFRRVAGQAFGAVTMSKWEIDTDRFGGDYASVDIKTDHIELCEAACRSDLKCLAWTYVKPAVPGAQALCWLKSVVPAMSNTTCCVSGTKINPR